MKKLIIIGAGGHGRVVADIAALNGYDDIAFLDDADISVCGEYPVIGKINERKDMYHDAEYVVAIGNNHVRANFCSWLKEKGARLATLIHPRSAIAQSVRIGIGTVVMAGAVVNPYAVIGDGVILNTCSSVDHDSYVGDYSHISVGAHLCGSVKVGEKVFAGAGSTVINNISVCDDAILGAGTVVINDINETGTYVGVPAEKIK